MSEDGEIKLSANRINMYLKCPLSIYYRFRGYPECETERKYIANGLAVHNLLEDRVKGIIKEPEFYWNEQQVPEEMRETFNLCVKNAEQFFDCGGKPEETIHKHFTTPKGRKIDLEARIDLQTEDTLWDYKTGGKVDKPEYKLQGQIYLFCTDFKYQKAKFISLQTNEILEIDQPPKDYIPKLADRYCDAIEENNYPKKQSFLCKWCPYYRWCLGDLQYENVETVKANPEKYNVVLPQWRN